MPSKPINDILDFCFDHNLEIVSFGLAPNPNGFCFEDHNLKEPNIKAQKKLNEMLNQLTKKQESELKSYVFN